MQFIEFDTFYMFVTECELLLSTTQIEWDGNNSKQFHPFIITLHGLMDVFRLLIKFDDFRVQLLPFKFQFSAQTIAAFQ